MNDNINIVSMIRKYHNNKAQLNPWHREKEPHNHHETPFRTVQSVVFRNIVHKCEQRYVFPCRGTFSETVIPRMYDSVSAHFKGEQRLYNLGISWIGFGMRRLRLTVSKDWVPSLQPKTEQEKLQDSTAKKEVRQQKA